tara:strand:- start:450 stop:842 length:393 start_codon:yes stop_codon:yes gene_type:complete
MEEMDYYIRTCRYCEKTFVINHGNRYFCDPATQEIGQRNCKVTYNNFKAKSRRGLTEKFNNRVYSNWEILNTFWCREEFVVSGETLESMNFSVPHFTGYTHCSKTGVKIPIFFDYQLENLGDNNFKLLKK